MRTRALRAAAVATCLALAAFPTSLAAQGSAPDPSAAPLETSLQAAIEAYTAALESAERDARMAAFRRAEQWFERAIAGGARNADLYANLGNAALQAERLGPAILAYRRALELDPSHARAVQNLDYARRSLPEWVPRVESGGFSDSFFFWHRSLSRSARRTTAALAFFAAFATLALGIRLDRAGLRQLAILPAGIWLALVASLLLDPARVAEREVVITAPEATARAADSALAPTLFAAPLPGGTEARLLELRSPWAQIRLPNGRDAWIPESAFERVRP